jgi:hypothetical protein
MLTPRQHALKRNRPAAWYRATVIKNMWAAGHSCAQIAALFEISAERARQIVNAPLPPAQLALGLERYGEIA